MRIVGSADSGGVVGTGVGFKTEFLVGEIPEPTLMIAQSCVYDELACLVFITPHESLYFLRVLKIFDCVAGLASFARLVGTQQEKNCIAHTVPCPSICH